MVPAIGLPGPPDVGQECPAAQGEKKNDEQLQAGLQHGVALLAATSEKVWRGILNGTEVRPGCQDIASMLQADQHCPAHRPECRPKAVPEPLPSLSTAELETLLTALDPLLDGFGEGGSCLDDASAYLARLGIGAGECEGEGEEEKNGGSPLLLWIERWREAGGNRQTLRLMVSTLLAQRQISAQGGPPPEGNPAESDG